MQFSVHSRNKGLAVLIENTVKVLIQELNLSNSKWELTIHTQKGLAKNDEMRGVVGPSEQGQLIMLLDSKLSTDVLIETICHEMVHVKQFARGHARLEHRGKKTTFYWLGKKVKASYWDRPWEQEAWRKEKVLASKIYKIIAPNT